MLVASYVLQQRLSPFLRLDEAVDASSTKPASPDKEIPSGMLQRLRPQRLAAVQLDYNALESTFLISSVGEPSCLDASCGTA